MRDEAKLQRLADFVLATIRIATAYSQLAKDSL
jgi:hypothetical protein